MVTNVSLNSGTDFIYDEGCMKEKKYKRKYIVNRKYQFAQAAVAVSANLLTGLLVAALVVWFYLLFYGGPVVADHNRDLPVFLIAVALAVATASSLWSLRRSHSVAGIVKKMEIVLQNAARGTLPEGTLTFRKGDCFPALADPLNQCLNRQKDMTGAIESSTRILSEVLGGIENGKVNEAEISVAVKDAIKQLQSVAETQEPSVSS